MSIRLEVNQDIESEIEAVIFDGEERLIEFAIARNADKNGYQGWLVSPDEEAPIYWRELPKSINPG